MEARAKTSVTREQSSFLALPAEFAARLFGYAETIARFLKDS